MADNQWHAFPEEKPADTGTYLVSVHGKVGSVFYHHGVALCEWDDLTGNWWGDFYHRFTDSVEAWHDTPMYRED